MKRKTRNGTMMTRKPEIEVSSNAFKITLPNRNASSKFKSVVSESMRSDEEAILDFISVNGYVTRSTVEKLLGISQSTANRILKRMLDSGLLLQECNGRRTRYERK